MPKRELLIIRVKRRTAGFSKTSRYHGESAATYGLRCVNSDRMAASCELITLRGCRCRKMNRALGNERFR